MLTRWARQLMANSIRTIKPKDFPELLGAIENFQAQSQACWYRGVSNESHNLRPSLFRHKSKTEISEISSLEISITTRFVQRSLPFLSRILVNDWDKIFFMQHYGVPTRLLDWTENPFVAVYFALDIKSG